MAPVRLVIADVDGTLLTDDKTLTHATIDAVSRLRGAGVSFTLASARPPLGLRFPIMQLGVTSPVAAFNGGMIVHPEPGMPAYHSRTLATRVVKPVAQVLALFGLDMWAYCGLDWYVKDRNGPRVQWEADCVSMYPRTVSDWSELPGRPSKLVGVSDNANQVGRAKERLDYSLRTAISAAQSTPFYLEITPPGVDKGTAAHYLAGWHAVKPGRVAVIGDGMVDIPMFLYEKGVTSIAMGNAPSLVQSMATHVTASNEQDGFAKAVDQFILA